MIGFWVLFDVMIVFFVEEECKCREEVECFVKLEEIV